MRLPADWQTRMVDMIRGAAPLDGTWFTGGPALSPQAQIAVYREQYRLRLFDAVVIEAPGLAKLLGVAMNGDAPDPAWLSDVDGPGLIHDYIADCPSRSWTLDRVADALADWLRDRGARVELVEMARLDHAVQRGFAAAEGMPLRAEDLSRMPRLALQPHVSLLRNRTNVHRVRSALLSGDAPPDLVPGDFPLVIFRRGVRMRHWEIPLGSWGILCGIQDGLEVGSAIERAFARGWLSMDQLGSELGAWFADFAERNLVQLAGPTFGDVLGAP